ncbi:heavy metal translocating P-type ATPase [Plastorhodobacter daqingensis]|uniref:Heavy metal translocating P-type ATPase n=1 Tax=Plastorhodobacter daqingensis TaxID=1387281 RepID=A0ABW2UIV9_9RHOB
MSVSRTLLLPLTGISCAGCIGRAERAVASLSGVDRAEASLATSTLRIEGGFDLAEVAAALARAGYPAAETRTRLALHDMTCASCVGRVERALQQVEGVLEASVNLATETATVRHIALPDCAEALVRAATAAGYPAEIIGDRPDPAQATVQSDETRQMARRTLVAGALTLPVFMLEMGSHAVPAMHHWVMDTIGMWESWILQFLLTTAVLAGPGRRFYRQGFPALVRGAPDMNSLVAVGTSAAYGFSVIATFAPSLLPEGSRAVYFEAAAVIVTLILLGRWLEARARGRTGAAIARLVGLQPRAARVEREGVTVDMPVEAIRPGDRVHLRPGERVAVDGEVVSGSSFLDESMITGEPVPVQKLPGATVTGGTVNGSGALVFRATHVGADTVLARIIRMVQDAQGAKLPIQALVDRVTYRFVPAVMAIAALTLAGWLLAGAGIGPAMVASVAVLIIACPCAMGLATPTSIMVGTGRAADLGVLFRRGGALQALAGVRTVAFDKTGTLTEGRPALVALELAPGQKADEILRLVAAVEARSEHPVGRAIVEAAEARGLALPEVVRFAALTGLGLQAEVDGRSILVGADRLMTRERVSLGALADAGAARAARGDTPLYVAIDGTAAAMIAVADRMKASTPGAIAALHRLGLRVAMISGDNRATAMAIAAELGIDHVVAEVLPDGKVEAIRALQAEGSVAFVGDGVNDAPALAAADVGVAIGTGTDVAIESAEVVLMSGDLNGVINALEVSRHTMRNIRQNLFWAFAYNTALIPVAAGVLFPAFGLLLSPPLAAGAMALSSVFVLANALRLRRVAADRRGSHSSISEPTLASGAIP